jgi:hypothetical protein
MLTGWSLEAPVSEAQFLRRELGVTWRLSTEGELRGVLRVAGASRRALIVCSHPEPYAELLRSAPPQSVVLLMISDESYSRSRIDLVRNSPSVAAVCRHYATTPASLAAVVKESAAFLQAARGTSVSSLALPWMVWLLKTGLGTRARMRQWRNLGIPVHAVALGYTNVFADSFVDVVREECSYQIGDDQSLFDAAIPLPRRTRTIRVTFRGQRGQAQRRVMVERAQGQPGADIRVFGKTWSGYDGGDRGRTYVESLLNAQFALCPPGGINLESFRYYEALLCGARPVEPVTALTHQGIVTARGIDARGSVVASLRATQVELAERCMPTVNRDGH